MQSKPRNKPGPKPKKKAEKPPEIGQNNLEPPDFLGNDARKYWFQYRDLLVKAKMLTDADVAAFAAFCDQLGLVDKAEAEIEKHGLLIDDQRGSYKSNPAIGIKNRAWTQVLAFAKQLGLTPKARNQEARNLPPAGGGVNGDTGSGQEVSAQDRRVRLFKVAN